MNRRKKRKTGAISRRHTMRNTENGGHFTTVVIVICLSLIAGYLAAVYIVGPVLGLDTAPLTFNEETSGNDDTKKESEEQQDTDSDEIDGLAESGYVLQYGSFSSREAAESCVSDLKLSGIEAEILEKDGAYKVVSPLFDTEQEARAKMETQKNYVDVFITHFP